jgi:hypothetical protein
LIGKPPFLSTNSCAILYKSLGSSLGTSSEAFCCFLGPAGRTNSFFFSSLASSGIFSSSFTSSFAYELLATSD